jgi:SNF2 family DNA or RNA helicase
VNFDPREWQIPIRNHILNNERCNVFSGMGTGKTPASLDAIDTLRYFGESKHAIVFAPKLVAEVTWAGEIEKFKERFGHLSIAVAIGTPQERIAALKRRAHITTINYENIPWLVDVLGDEWFFDTVFPDEATRLKGLRIAEMTSSKGKKYLTGQGSVRGRALKDTAHNRVRRWVNLTGSPCPNGLQDLWGINWFVDAGTRLGRSFGAFRDRWFDTPMVEGRAKLIPKKFAFDQITNSIRDVCLTIDIKDYVDISKPIETIRSVRLPPRARAIYDQMEDEMWAEFRAKNLDIEVEAKNSGSKLNKCLQIGSGNVYYDDQGNWAEVHDQKIEALRSIIEEAAGASILIAYSFKPELERILKAFPRARQLRTAKDILDFQEGRLQLGVAHPSSVGHGHSLQKNCWIMCYYSTGFNLELDEQILERVGPTRQWQSGLNRAVFVYRIVAEDTVEDRVALQRIREKAATQETFKGAMKMGVQNNVLQLDEIV